MNHARKRFARVHAVPILGLMLLVGVATYAADVEGSQSGQNQSFNIGTHPTGTLAFFNFSLTNPASSPASLQITEISDLDAGLVFQWTAGTDQCTGATLQPGESCTRGLRFECLTADLFEDSFQWFTSVCPDGRTALLLARCIDDALFHDRFED